MTPALNFYQPNQWNEQPTPRSLVIGRSHLHTEREKRAGGGVSIELEQIEVNVTSAQCVYRVSQNPTTASALEVNTETLVAGVRLETVYEASCINFQQEEDCSSEGLSCL